MTTLITPLVGATVDNTPTRCDIKLWRGDTLQLPWTFMDNAKETEDGVAVLGDGTLTSLSNVWVSGDVGKAIVGDKIPFGAVIGTYNSPFSVTLDSGLLAIGDKSFARFRWGIQSDQSQGVFSAQVRSHPDAGTADASFTVDSSLSGFGLLTITLSSGATSGLRPGRHFWDLQRVQTGVRRTLIAGAFVVQGDITRP